MKDAAIRATEGTEDHADTGTITVSAMLTTLDKGSHITRRPLYTIKEAQDILRRSRSTLYSMIAEGRIKRTKIGGRTLITDAEIVRVISEGAEAR